MSYPNNPPVPASITVDTTASINSGLVGFWPLTDGTGTTATDLSTGGNDGTLTNSPSWVSSSVGSAIKFTEANPNENVSLTSTLLGTTHTISFWASQYYDGNVLGGDGGPTGGDSKIYMSSSGLKYTADSWGGGTTSSPPAKSGMFHVCVVRNSTTTDWYVDGVFFQQTSFTSSTRQFELASIGGADISSWNGYSGTVQNVRIWTRALTPTEVAELYSVPWAGTDYVAQNLTPDTPLAMGVDPNHSLSSGLVGYWPLSDGSGTTAKDISGNSYTGTARSSQGWAVTSIGTAADNTSLTNGGFTYGDQADLDMNGDKSFSMWVNPNGGSVVQVLFEKRSSTGGLEGYSCFFRCNTDSTIGFLADSGSSTTSVSSASALPLDTWSHVCVVVSGNDATVYIDGSPGTTVTSTDFAADLSNTVDFVTGYGQRDPGSQDDFDGSMQNVRIYNRALSATEVESLYNEPWAGVVTAKSAPPQYLTVDTADSINTGLQGFWPLSDGSGTTAVDLSGNANNGTQSGGVTWTADDKGVSASFDGVDDEINIGSITSGNSLMLNGTDATISVWFRSDRSGETYPRLIEKATGGSGTGGWSLFLDSDPSVTTFSQYSFLVNGTKACAYASSNPYPSDWTHLVVTMNSSTCAMYENGVPLSLTVNSPQTIPNTTGPCSIGSGSTLTNRHLGGDLSNVRVYNRALSAAEVSRLYQDPWAGTNRAIEPSPTAKDLDTSSSLTTNLVGWWPLTEFGPQDTLAYDISGNGNHGVANGGVQRQFTDTVRAATFDGVDDYFEIDGDPTGSGDRSYSMWVSVDSGVTSSFTMFQAAAGAQFRDQIIGDNVSGGRIAYDTYPSSAGTFTRGNFATVGQGWRHIAVTISGGAVTIYGDAGVIATGTEETYSGSTPTKCYIGYRSGTEFMGNIQNVRVYSRALSAAEVQTLYDDPWVGLATDSLVYAYYSAAFLQRLG